MARRFRGKSKRDLKRRDATREVPARVLIVTEGARTEPDYFRRLIRELGLRTAQVKIAGEGGSAPVSVVDYAKRLLKQDSDFEQVYLVFDKDNHDSYGRALTDVQILGKKRCLAGKTILAATSIPCFEIWLWMHVSERRRPYAGASPGADLLSDLKRHASFTDYAKGSCACFDAIAADRDTAKSRAETFLRAARAEGSQEHHENPSTRIHLVVGALETLSKVNRNA